MQKVPVNLREPNDGDNKLSQNLELVLERIVGWSQHLEQTLAETSVRNGFTGDSTESVGRAVRIR